MHFRRHLSGISCAALFAAQASAASLPPSPSPRFISGGPYVTYAGDSTASIYDPANPPGTGYGGKYQWGPYAAAPSFWLNALSNGAILTDYAAFGYPGSLNGILKIMPTTTGSCPALSTLTVTATGYPTQPTGLTLTTDSSGHVQNLNQWVFPTTQGVGTGSTPVFAFSPSCTTSPTLNYAVSGVGTFGVFGDTTAGLIARIPDICAAKPDWVEVKIGTNDLGALQQPATTVMANDTIIQSGLLGCGVHVMWTGITPRNQGSSPLWTATNDEARIRVNRHRMMLASQEAAVLNLSLPPYVDYDRYWVNPAASGGSIGNPFATMPTDGLHPALTGAFYEALADLQFYSRVLPPSFDPVASQSDIYDATNNPGGNLMGVPAGLFIGSTSSPTTPCNGTMPYSWSATFTGTGTLTCTTTISSTRTDGLPGNEWVLTIANVGGGASDNLQLSSYLPNVANITTGTDSLQLTIPIDVSNVTGTVSYLGAQIYENATVPQQMVAGISGAISASNPMPTSATLAAMADAKVLPKFGMTAAGSFEMRIKTPPGKTQSGATGYSTYIQVGIPGTTTINLHIRPLSVRKTNAQ